MAKIEVIIKDKKLCPRYSAWVVEGLKLEESSPLIQERLSRFGIRPINNVVDATNYVTLELGQPLHAFDAGKIKGPVILRGAKKNETVVTLDGKCRQLEFGMLVLENNGQLIDLAGIMGGKLSAISRSTTSILLQAAVFSPRSIRATSKALNQKTMASHIYERGLDPELADCALARALELIGGRVTQKIALGEKEPLKQVLFDPALVEGVSRLKAEKILNSLGFRLKAGKVTVPSWRLDISIAPDLAEEILRLNGYEKIIAAMPVLRLVPPTKARLQFWKKKVLDILASLGFTEVYNYAFSRGKTALKIQGQASYLRPSLLPRLKENIKENLKNFSEVKIFELGKVYKREGEHWSLGLASFDFLGLKGGLEYLFSELGIKELDLDRGIESEGRYWFWETNFEALAKRASSKKDYQPISEFPSIKRDLSVLVNVETKAGELLASIKRLAGDLLNDLELFDVYIGKGLPDQAKSLAFHLTYQSFDKTLTVKAVNQMHRKIEQGLEREFPGAKVR